MADSELTCSLEMTPTSDGEIALAFEVHNPGPRPVEIRYFQPFFSFDLSVQADGGPVHVAQPAYNVQVHPVTATVAPGESAHIETPVHLRFDPQAPPSGGNVPTRWTLLHAPAPVRVHATLHLGDLTLAPCAAHFTPPAAH